MKRDSLWPWRKQHSGHLLGTTAAKVATKTATVRSGWENIVWLSAVIIMPRQFHEKIEFLSELLRHLICGRFGSSPTAQSFVTAEYAKDPFGAIWINSMDYKEL